jgi:AcrR family transcriptional regulator
MAEVSLPRRRLKPEVRRRLILDAARACIAERGLAATTAREIASYAGVSTGTITHHFDSIPGILAEALRQGSEEFTSQFVEAASKLPRARDQLYLVIDANLPDAGGAAQLWSLWAEVWARAPRDELLAAVHAERHSVERAALEQMFRRGAESGELVCPDPAGAAAEFLGLLDGLGLQAAIGDPQMDVDRARSLLRAFIDRLVR